MHTRCVFRKLSWRTCMLQTQTSMWRQGLRLTIFTVLIFYCIVELKHNYSKKSPKKQTKNPKTTKTTKNNNKQTNNNLDLDSQYMLVTTHSIMIVFWLRGRNLNSLNSTIEQGNPVRTEMHLRSLELSKTSPWWDATRTSYMQIGFITKIIVQKCDWNCSSQWCWI